MYKYFMSACLLMLISFSCVDDSPEANDIMGSWNWLSSTGAIAGITLTPKDTGENIVFEFTTDSVFRQYRNDTLVSDTNFSIITSTSIYNHEQTKMIEISGSFRRSFSFSTSGELILSDEVYDGYISRYKRIK
ncbi:hypothetical protein [uncultured Draconibacterium sp.]|uniref:hypothetical protein n=1 Tax=uncultured Draconibacterium sp. TaxID=1573823 RepID=UPI00326034AA